MCAIQCWLIRMLAGCSAVWPPYYILFRLYFIRIFSIQGKVEDAKRKAAELERMDQESAVSHFFISLIGDIRLLYDPKDYICAHGHPRSVSLKRITDETKKSAKCVQLRKK